MQLLFQILKAASLLCRQVLHSASGSIINSKPLRQKPAFVPPKHPNLLHLCLHTVSIPLLQHLFLRSSPPNVITASRLKKRGFFGHSHVITSNHSHLTEEVSWFNDLHCHWPGRYKTQAWQQMVDSHTLTFSDSTVIRSRLAYKL